MIAGRNAWLRNVEPSARRFLPTVEELETFYPNSELENEKKTRNARCTTHT